jgi:hypothetical protein
VKSQATSRDTAAARLQGEPNHRSTRDSRTHQPKRRGGETHTLKYSTENTRGDGDGSGSVGAGVHPRRSGRSGGREKFTQKITRTRLLSSHLFAGRQAGRQAGSRREVGERGRREERDVFSLFFRPGPSLACGARRVSTFKAGPSRLLSIFSAARGVERSSYVAGRVRVSGLHCSTSRS